MKRTLIAIVMTCMTGHALAKVDLVTLPARDTVQLTIYNSADLTLARESRALTLCEGVNRLQFSWENTLIDPTSLEMTPKAFADRIEVSDLTYPPRVRNLGLWDIQSQIKDKVPVEISYLTSGLAWRAFYMGTLSTDERTMSLQGYVRVTNNSGEDYENAQVRLIVGRIHLLDQIAELARREHPYGSPTPPVPAATAAPMRQMMEIDKLRTKASLGYGFASGGAGGRMAPKAIEKEGLSEYFLYTIEGTETIPTGWSKRLASLAADGVPVVNLYKFEEERYGRAVVRFLSFKNDKEHKLGDTPIPDGRMKVFRLADQATHLAYEGQSSFKYIPVGEDVELNLGPVADVVVEPTLVDFKTENHRFDKNGNVAGYDEVKTVKLAVRNTREIPVDVDIRRNFGMSSWDLDKTGDFDAFAKVDKDTVKFILKLAARSGKTFEYKVRIYKGTRQEDWRP